MLESEIEKWLGKQMEKLGCLNFKFVSPGNPGVPDRIYITPAGQVWFVELKQQFGRISGIQKWQRQRLTDQGCNYLLVKGLKDAQAFVALMKQQAPEWRREKDAIQTARISEICN